MENKIYKNQRFQLFEPLRSNKIYICELKLATHKCFNELKNSGFKKIKQFSIINIDTNQIFSFKINYNKNYNKNYNNSEKDKQIDILHNKIKNNYKNNIINENNIENVNDIINHNIVENEKKININDNNKLFIKSSNLKKIEELNNVGCIIL